MKRMLIDDTQPEETRVVIVDGNKIEDVEFESSFRKQIKGNIFSAKVIRIEPSLQACFIDYGGNRHGFLAFGEIHPDYYNISDEIKQEVEKEVDEIIERKRQYQLERQAERERRRLEREQKRAEYEARMKAEAEALALEKAKEEGVEVQDDEMSNAQNGACLEGANTLNEENSENNEIKAQNTEVLENAQDETFEEVKNDESLSNEVAQAKEIKEDSFGIFGKFNF